MLATEKAHEAGYRRMECYTPYPVEEAAVALRFHKTRVPLVCLLGGIMGLTTAYLMETWINVWGYPLNIAGRPLLSWPMFIIPAYEWTILFSGLSAAFGMIALERDASALPSALQRAELPQRSDDRQVLFMSRGDRPAVFVDRDTCFSGAVSCGLRSGGGALMRITGDRATRCWAQPTGNSSLGLRRTVFLGALAGALISLAGCRQDMHNQPKFYPQRGSDFYADGRSVRPQVENTVARNQMHENAYFYTGFVNGKEGDGLPFPVTMQVMQRGQERYNVYCTPCHSRVGNGAGMIVQRGYAAAGNFHTARLEAAPLGHFFNVISNGYGAMPDYSAQLTPADRWAVVAYIRALQLSQKATQADVADGAHVEPLSDIAQRNGFAPGFANDWGLPMTAVKGTPNGEDFAIPVQVNNAPSSGAGNCGNRRAGPGPAAGISEHRSGQRNEQAITSEASERRFDTHVIGTRTTRRAPRAWPCMGRAFCLRR